MGLYISVTSAADKVGVSSESLLNIWDGAHLLELSIGDVFNGAVGSGFPGVPLISKTIKTLGKIACFMSFGEKFTFSILYSNNLNWN